MLLSELEENQRNWREGLIFSSTVLGLTTFIWFLTRFEIHGLYQIWSVVLFTETLIWLTFWLVRKTKGSLTYYFLFVAQISTTLLGTIVSQRWFLSERYVFELFAGIKILTMLVAAIGPVKKVAGWIVLVGVWVVTFYEYLSWPQRPPQTVTVQDPWSLVITCVVSLFIFYLRTRLQEKEIEMMRTQLREKLIGNIASTLVGVQHLLNTPLQVLSNSIEGLKKKYSDSDDSLDLAERSLKRIYSLSQVFSSVGYLLPEKSSRFAE